MVEDVTVAQFEAAINAKLGAAQAAGEAFLDVFAREVNRALGGKAMGSLGMSRCCDTMRRMMLPGDAELSSSDSVTTKGLIIRYALPRRATTILRLRPGREKK